MSDYVYRRPYRRPLANRASWLPTVPAGPSTLWVNCVAAWRLTDLTDATGRGNTLTNNNGVTFPTGGIGKYAQFVRATSQSLSIADNADLSTGDVDFWFGFRVWLDSKPGTMAFAGKWNDNTTTVEYASWYDSGSDRIKFAVENYTAVITGSTFGSPSTGQWVTVMCWHDSVNNTINLRINNVSETPVSYSGGVTDTNQAFRIGADNFPFHFLDGRMDAVAFAKKVPSSQDQTDFWNSGNGVEFPADVVPREFPMILLSD